MPIINCYVDDETLHWLEKAAVEKDRTIADLAEASIANSAIDYKVSHPDYRQQRKTAP